MGSGGGGSSGDQTNTIRYAPYVESKHQAFLNAMATKRGAVIDESPFSTFTDFDIDTAYLGSGILISSYSSVFGTFETFMKNVDIDQLFIDTLDSTLTNEAVKNAVAAEGKLLSDDLETDALPRFMAGARDINAVMSSTFVMGKSNLEAKRLKLLSKFSTRLKISLIPFAQDRWSKTLNWKANIAQVYSALMNAYLSSSYDADKYNYEMKAKDSLWPFTVLEYERAALGALQGAKTENSSVAGSSVSDTAKVVGGAASGAVGGAYIGAQIGSGYPGIGTAIGAVVGGLAGLIAG